jgi:hypothetical protein
MYLKLRMRRGGRGVGRRGKVGGGKIEEGLQAKVDHKDISHSRWVVALLHGKQFKGTFQAWE